MIVRLANGDKIWTPNPGRQERALSIDIFELLYGGARGGGKTEAGIVWIAIPACGPQAHPEYRGLVIRENYKDLLQWVDRAKVFYIPYGGVWKASEQQFVFPNGAKITLGHMEDPDAFKHYQGNQYHRLLWEELTQCSDEMMYVKLLASVRSVVRELRPAVFATANPGGPGHGWVKKRFINPSVPERAFWDPEIEKWRIFIPAGIEDNPALMEGDPGYEKMLNGIPDENLRRAWRFGDWDILEGQYFTEFSRFREVPDGKGGKKRIEWHVVTPYVIPDNWERHIGLDWGYKPDPYATLFYAISPRGKVVQYREMWGNEKLPETVAKEAMAFCPRRESVIAGPDLWSKRNAPDSSADQMIEAGLEELTRANDDRLNGWMRVHEYLQRTIDGEPALQIFSTCVKTIEGITGMIHDERHPQDAMKDSKIDHWPDAMRYFLMSRPAPPEEEEEPEKQYPNERTRRAAEYLRRIRERGRQRKALESRF